MRAVEGSADLLSFRLVSVCLTREQLILVRNYKQSFIMGWNFTENIKKCENAPLSVSQLLNTSIHYLWFCTYKTRLETYLVINQNLKYQLSYYHVLYSPHSYTITVQYRVYYN